MNKSLIAIVLLLSLALGFGKRDACTAEDGEVPTDCPVEEENKSRLSFGAIFQSSVESFMKETIANPYPPSRVQGNLEWKHRPLDKKSITIDHQLEIQLTPFEIPETRGIDDFIKLQLQELGAKLITALPDDNPKKSDPRYPAPNAEAMTAAFDAKLASFEGIPPSLIELSQKIKKYDNDTEGDALVIYLVTKGLAAPFLEPLLPPIPADGFQYYTLDFTALKYCEIVDNQNFLPYGASATLRWSPSTKWQLVSIAHALENPEKNFIELVTVTNPGSQTTEWVFAKQKLLTTISVYVTLVHLVVLHLASASSLPILTAENLDGTHPLFGLLLPFFYRSSLINTNAVELLVPEWGVFHRMTAFTYPGMQNAMKIIYKRCTHDLIRLPLMDDGSQQALLLSPLVGDFRDFKAKLEQQLREVIYAVYPDEESLHADKSMDGFFASMKNLLDHIRNGSKQSRSSLVKVLAQAIFEVTACHEIFGNMSPHVRNPYTGPFALRIGSTPADRLPNEERILLAQFLGIFVSEVMPPLLGDYSHVTEDGVVKAFFSSWPVKWNEILEAQKQRNHPDKSEIDLEQMAMSVAI